MSDPRNEDFLDAPTYTEPAYASPEALESPRRRVPAAAVTAGWLVAGLVLGGVGVAVMHAGHGTSANSGVPAAATGQAPGVGFGRGFGGGVAGEQHVFGTLTAVDGAALTVRTTSGTSTYTIDASTALVKDGQRVSSLAAMQVGDPVVVHVYPQNGTQHVEVVIDGGLHGGGDDNGQDDDGSGGTVTHT